MRFTAVHLRAIARRLLMAAGTPRHIADDVAEILVNANLSGHDSHGVLRIPGYLESIEKGALRPAAEPTVIRETTSVLIIDGNHGFGHYVARQAMAWVIERTSRVDVCCASLTRLGHIGRLGEYAEQAARAGCIGLVTWGRGGGDRGIVAPYAGNKGALSTNPIAVGVPAGDGAPFILDYATSVIAEGKIQVARSKGVDLPEGRIIDRQGHPSVKPADFYDGGFLLPFGAHKGYALGVLGALLGGLSGDFDPARGSMEGAFMQAINVRAFVSLEDYQRAVRALLDRLRATPPAPGFSEVLAPGDPEHRERTRRLAAGIEVPEAIHGQLGEWAERLRVSLDDDVEP